MGCNGSRGQVFRKKLSSEPQPPPHGNPITVDEQPRRSYNGRERVSIRKPERVSTRGRQSLDQPERGHQSVRYGEDQVMDQKKVERLLERQKSERQAMEAFRADAALSDPMYLPEVREIIEIDDDMSRVNRYAPLGYQFPGSTMNAQSNPVLFEGAPNYGNPYGYSSPMMMSQNRYQPSSAVQSRYVPGIGMQPLHSRSWSAIPDGGVSNHDWNPYAAPMRTRSMSYIPAGTVGPVLMGQRPIEEDSTPQRQIIHSVPNHFNTGALLSEHLDDPFETPADKINSTAYFQPIGKQMSDPFDTRHSPYGYQKQNGALTVDHLSSKSTETKWSKYGEASTDMDGHKWTPSIDPDPITDPFGVGCSMGEMLEGILSDDSDSSSNAATSNNDGKTKGEEEDNWETLLDDVNECLTTSSSERDTKGIATKMDPIYEHSWQVDGSN